MILRFCVVIPTCDHGRTISESVKDAVLNTTFPILVVDDGSEQPTQDCLYSWEVRHALEAGRVKVLRLPEKRGKGVALKSAILELVKNGFTHMLTLDANGQFKASETTKLVNLSRRYPWDMIIGDRQIEKQADMSAIRRKLSNLLINYQTGSHIQDTRSGCRVYPLLPMQNMNFLTSGEDFENEALIRLLWQGMHVHETEVETNAREKVEKIGLLTRLGHNVRVSILHTFLILVSLFKTHRSVNEVAWALGLGVFIGCTPFFGFHTLIIVGVALLFRLNLVVMWLGTHVSTPILWPFLTWLELFVGKNWLHLQVEEGTKARDELYRLLGGSAVVGVGLGLAAVLAVYVISWVVRRRKRYSNWSAKRRGGKFGRMILRNALKRFGQLGAYRLVSLTLMYFYFFSPKARRGLGEYWKLRDPRLGWWKRQRQVLEHMRTFGEILIDRGLRSMQPDYPFAITATGVEELNRAITAHKGAILLGAHLGAWDLAAELAVENPGRVKLVSLRREGYRFYTLQESMDPTRNRLELRGPLASAGEAIRESLARGETLVIMGDRPLGDHYQLIPFMGRLAPFDMTVFRLAADAGVPVFFNFGFREERQKFQYFVSAGKHYKFDPTLPREIQCYRWAREYVGQVEKYARKFPYEWFNLYPFWSAPPTVLSGELAAQGDCRLIEEFGEAARHFPEY